MFSAKVTLLRVLELSLKEAFDRALKYNLGLIESAARLSRSIGQVREP